MKKRVSIFGSTGSIGTSTLNVIRNNLDLFEVITLVAGENIKKLIEQINEFKPKHVYIKSEENSRILKSQFKDLDIYYGKQGMKDISNLTDYDIAVSALVGIAGLEPTYNMIKNGKTVALANKEVLVDKSVEFEKLEEFRNREDIDGSVILSPFNTIRYYKLAAQEAFAKLIEKEGDS